MQKSRDELKSYFKSGNRPSETQFSELIDSVPNIVDDEVDGVLRSYPKRKEQKVAEFYCAKDRQEPAWSFYIDDQERLAIFNRKEEVVLAITQEREIAFVAEEKKTEEYRELPADGGWHNIAIDKDEEGLQVYRVFASYKDASSGRCYLCEAIASQQDAMYSELTSSKKRWWGWSGPIQFRWSSFLGKLHLQIRCRNRARMSGKVYYQIVKLWDYIAE